MLCLCSFLLRWHHSTMSMCSSIYATQAFLYTKKEQNYKQSVMWLLKMFSIIEKTGVCSYSCFGFQPGTIYWNNNTTTSVGTRLSWSSAAFQVRLHLMQMSKRERTCHTLNNIALHWPHEELQLRHSHCGRYINRKWKLSWVGFRFVVKRSGELLSPNISISSGQ